MSAPAFDERLAEIARQLEGARAASQAAGFITSEFLPMWWESWRAAFVNCPAAEVGELEMLRAEMRVVTAFEQQLKRWAEQAPVLEEQVQEVAAQAVEEWRAGLEPGEE